MKNNYDMSFVDLGNEISSKNIKHGKYHYNYKTVDFMFNYKENTEKLLIIFHGRIYHTEQWPVFYKYNYEKDNISVLSICDKLLEINRELHNVLFLSTEKIDYRKIYQEIIKYFIDLVSCNKNIFYGSCSGTYTALYYASIFKQYFVGANGYVSISDDIYKSYDDKIYKKHGFRTIYINTYEVIQKSQPKHIYLYINKYDTITYEMNKNFILFCKKYFPDIMTALIHDNKIDNKDPHDIHFPKNENFDTIIDKI